MRDEFLKSVVETLAKRVGQHCSNPGCHKTTSGPHTVEDKALIVGVAAHISAASPGGPRYDASLTAAERTDIRNGIWLCQSCAKLVDNDELRYTKAVLLQWKQEAEAAALQAIETTYSDQKGQTERTEPRATSTAFGGMRLRHLVPQNSDDFEHLCCQLLKSHWKNPHLQTYGRRGESQEGVDIYDPLQRVPVHAAQCKLHDSVKSIRPAEIEREVERAKTHPLRLDHYVILTSAKKSTWSDQKIAEINERHTQQGLFTVELLTWDQIEILLDQHPDVQAVLYGRPPNTQSPTVIFQSITIQFSLDAVPSETRDAIDSELDAVKDLIERRRLARATERIQGIERQYTGKLTPRQHWRLVSMNGGLSLQKGEFDVAGRLFLQALTFQPSEEKALVNAALAHYLLGDSPKAFELIVPLREKYPHSSQAAAVWVRVLPDARVFEEMEAGVAEFALNEVDVVLGMAVRYLELENASRGEGHAKRATELGPLAPQAWLTYAQAIHIQAMQETRISARAQRLQDAKDAYARAIELANAQEGSHIAAAGYLGRATAASSQNEPTADDDFKAARRLDPSNADTMRKYAVHLLVNDQTDGAVREATAACDVEPSPESKLLLAGILWERGQDNDQEAALDICLNVLPEGKSGRFDDLLNLAIAGLVKFKRFDDAHKLLDSLHVRAVSEVGRLSLLAEIDFVESGFAPAESLAQRAFAKVDDKTANVDLRRLARVLALVNLYSSAVEVLKRFVIPGRFDLDAQMLLDCANRAHDDGTILDVCQALREAGVEDRRLLHNEVDILQKYNRPRAIAVLQEHLKGHPNDKLARLRLSLFGLQDNNSELVTSDPALLPAVDDAHPETVGFGVVRVLFLTGQPAAALKYAYDVLRLHFGDAEAHLMYCAILLQSTQGGLRLETPEVVSADTAVEYRFEGDSKSQFLVIEDDAPERIRDEFSMNDSRVRSALGKKVGDSFVLTVAGEQVQHADIVSLRHKFVYRYQDCFDKFQVRFPDRREIQRFQLQADPDDAASEIDLRPILAKLAEQRNYVLNALRAYSSQAMPVNVLANVVGRNVFETMGFLTENPRRGVQWCCLGNQDERNEAMKSCRENKTVVLDMTALFTIWRLELAELLSRWKTRQFIIAQSTWDAFHGMVESEESRASQGRMGLDEQGNFFMSKPNEQDMRRHVESLRSFEKNVREFCNVVSVVEAANLTPDERSQMAEMFGRDGLQSIVLAAKPGHLLWSDDLTPLICLREDYSSSRWAWTQVITQVATEEGVLDKEQTDSVGARLIGMGYQFTWSSADIVVKAAKLSDWNLRQGPLNEVVRQFGSCRTERWMRLGIAVQAVLGAFRAGASAVQRANLITGMLGQMASEGFAATFWKELRVAFGSDVDSAREVGAVIRDWVVLSTISSFPIRQGPRKQMTYEATVSVVLENERRKKKEQ